MIKKRPCIDVGRERPPNRVLDSSFLKVWVALLDLPDFFEANTVVLYAGSIFVELVMFLQSLG